MEELYSLLVPLSRTRIIVPRACVAEVASFTPKPGPSSEERPWFLGTMNWSEREIPVISFESACQLDVPPPVGRVRVVVLRCLGDALPGGFFGMVTQGFPQLVRVNKTVLEPDNSHEWPDGSPVICQLRMINQRPIIPDLELLEQMIADAYVAA